MILMALFTLSPLASGSASSFVKRISNRTSFLLNNFHHWNVFEKKFFDGVIYYIVNIYFLFSFFNSLCRSKCKQTLEMAQKLVNIQNRVLLAA